jgi:magnesium transporter
MIVNCVAYQNGRKIGDVPIDDISEVLKTPGLFVWIGLHEPDEALLRKLQEEFSLHELAIEDARHAYQRPKVEEYGDSLFVVMPTAQLVDGELQFGETHIFVGPRYIVTLRHGASLGYAEVRARCERRPQLLSKGPGFVLYALMDFIVDHYFPIVDGCEQELEGVEGQIFGEAALGRDTAAAIYGLKRDLLALKHAVSPMVDVCNRVLRCDSALIPEDTHPYFRDVYDHVIRINGAVDSLRELLTSALEANFSMISVRQNEVMKKLAAWAAILAVPTAVAGVYGMNFRFMPELQWRFGYALIMGLIVSACAFLFWRFKRAGWL